MSLHTHYHSATYCNPQPTTLQHSNTHKHSITPTHTTLLSYLWGQWGKLRGAARSRRPSLSLPLPSTISPLTTITTPTHTRTYGVVWVNCGGQPAHAVPIYPRLDRRGLRLCAVAAVLCCDGVVCSILVVIYHTKQQYTTMQHNATIHNTTIHVAAVAIVMQANQRVVAIA
jgi:hypothetical protein